MSITVKTPPLWISYWMAFSTVIVLWDAGYCFNRPRSMPGGDLAWIWWPYNRVPYSLVDLVYGIPAWEEGDGFVNAQALMNLIEATLNVEYLYLRHTSPKTLHLTKGGGSRPKYHGHAPLVGFATALMTVAKTSLYFLQEYFCGWCMVGHNTRERFWKYYVATNGVWLVVPLIVTIVLGRFIANGLMRDVANQIAYSEWTSSSTSSAGKTIDPPSSSTKAKGKSAASLPLASAIDKSPNGDTPRVTRRSAAAANRSTSSSGYAIPHPGAALPLTFNVDSLPVLIIGANRLAATRTFTFLEAGAKVMIVSPAPLSSANEEVQYRVENDGVKYYQVDFKDSNQWTMFMKGKKIVLACITDTLIGSEERKEGSVEVIHGACRSLGIPLNISDHPTLSTFSFPATHRFDGVAGPSHLQVSVSTNGKGCRLSGRIKREIVAKLPGSVGAAVDNVGRLRALAKDKDEDARASSGKGKGKEKREGYSLRSGSAQVSEDDPHTPLNEPVEQIGTPSLLSSVTKQLGHALDHGTRKNKGDDAGQLRRMRWVHQMSEYYSFEALARMSDREMEDALDTWQGVPTPSQPLLPHHDGPSRTTRGRSDSTLLIPRRRGRILLVGSGPGHPGLLTVAAYHALKSATLILSDKLVPSEVLALIPPTTRLHIAKKFPGNNEGAQNELMIQALQAAEEGEVVVRLKQGDPFVYGRGGEEVLYFREKGYEAVVLPGVTSVIAGPEMVGIPVTQRGVAESMVLCTGVGRAGKSISLPGYRKSRTLVILMGVARIGSIVATLTDSETVGPTGPTGTDRDQGQGHAGGRGRDGPAYPPYLPIAVIERASSPDQRVIVSTLRDIEQALKSVEERPPGMMLVGWAVLALEGKGRVDVLDVPVASAAGGEEGAASVPGEGVGVGVDEGISKGWMGGDRWRIREGFAPEFEEFLSEVPV